MEDKIKLPTCVEAKYGTEGDMRLVFLETLDVVADLARHISRDRIRTLDSKAMVRVILAELLVNAIRLRVSLPLDERFFVPDRPMFHGAPSDRDWLFLCVNAAEGYRRSPDTRAIYFPEHVISYVFETAKDWEISMESVVGAAYRSIGCAAENS